MADLLITNVTISKQTATVSRAGFGTPIFFTAHRAYGVVFVPIPNSVM